MLPLLLAILLTGTGGPDSGAAGEGVASLGVVEALRTGPPEPGRPPLREVAPSPEAARPTGDLEGRQERERLRVFLLTMGPGDEVWERFGHNALLIRDDLTGEATAWNWGLFDFGAVDFIPRFLRGTMLYSMGPAPLEPFLESYRRANRSVYANELHLTPEEAEELDAFVRWNYRPENRQYRYDYFRDNCSTRLRDALDGILGGVLRQRFAGRETPRTFRWHSRRMVQELFWIDQGMSHLMGPRGDRPISEWEAMFLPLELLALLQEVELDASDGGTRPLLGPRDTLFQADRPPAPTEAPGLTPLWPLLGLGLGTAVVALGRATRRRKAWARPVLAGVGTAWGLGAGVLGLLMVAAWFTDHGFIHWNINVLYTSPLGLALAAVLIPAGLRRRWWEGRPGAAARLLAAVIAALCLLAAVLQFLTILRQENLEAVTLALPVNLALAWTLGTAGGRALAAKGASPDAAGVEERPDREDRQPPSSSP